MRAFRRKLLGRKRNAVADVWGDLAARLGGRFETDRRGWETVRLTHRGWSVVLGKHVVQAGTTPVVQTRVRALYGGARDLTATVRPRAWYDRVVEALGFRTRLPLRRALLERYVVRGAPAGRLPSLLSTVLTEALLRAPEAVRLTVKTASRKDRKRLGEDTGEVSCTVTGIVLDPVALLTMVEVVMETLDALDRIGEARAPDA